MGASMNDPDDVASPCINVCTLDPANQVCLGCFRTLDEIAAWGSASNAVRAAICAALPRRRELFAASGAATMPPEWRPERCERCGSEFACGAEDASTPCWCTSYPPIDPADEAARCLCPACMAMAVRSRAA
jgi:predicted Fe-S protein YdhL (DUF1289 family)